MKKELKGMFLLILMMVIFIILAITNMYYMYKELSREPEQQFKEFRIVSYPEVPTPKPSNIIEYMEHKVPLHTSYSEMYQDTLNHVDTHYVPFNMIVCDRTNDPNKPMSNCRPVNSGVKYMEAKILGYISNKQVEDTIPLYATENYETTDSCLITKELKNRGYCSTPEYSEPVLLGYIFKEKPNDDFIPLWLSYSSQKQDWCASDKEFCNHNGLYMDENILLGYILKI